MLDDRAIAKMTLSVIVVIIIVVAGIGLYVGLTYKPTTTTTTLPTYPNVPNSAISALYPSTPVTIQQYAWSGFPPATAVQFFEAAFPNIHVQQTPNQDISGLLSALQTRSYVYDSFRIQYLQLPQEIQTGEVMNITSYIDTYFTNMTSQVSPSAQTLVSNGHAGNWYCFPEDFGPVAFTYRTDIFAKYHLQVPTTWAQFANDSTYLQSKNSSIYMTDFPPNEPSGDLMGLFWQAGGNMIVPVNSTAYDVVVNSTTNLNLIKYWGGLIGNSSHPGPVTAVNIYSNQFNTLLAGSEIASFVTAAAWYPEFVIQSTVPQQSGLWAVADMPQWSSSSFVTGVVGGSCLGVTANAKNPGAAALFDYFETETPTQVIPWMWVNGGQWTANTHYLQTVPNFTQANSYFQNQVIGNVYIKSQQHAGTQWVWSPYQITLQTVLQEQLTEAANAQISWTQALQNTETLMIGAIQGSGGLVVGVGS
jgi:multiple sugar transport system substrate-binding protein